MGPWSGQLLVDECRQLCFAHGADLGGSQLAILEDHERRDAANTEFGRNFPVFVDIHLGDLQFALVGAGHFIENGRNHLAGAAPFGPVVDQYRCARFQDIGLYAAPYCRWQRPCFVDPLRRMTA